MHVNSTFNPFGREKSLFADEKPNEKRPEHLEYSSKFAGNGRKMFKDLHQGKSVTLLGERATGILGIGLGVIYIAGCFTLFAVGLRSAFSSISNAVASATAENMAFKSRKFLTPAKEKIDFGIVSTDDVLSEAVKFQERMQQFDATVLAYSGQTHQMMEIGEKIDDLVPEVKAEEMEVDDLVPEVKAEKKDPLIVAVEFQELMQHEAMVLKNSDQTHQMMKIDDLLPEVKEETEIKLEALKIHLEIKNGEESEDNEVRTNSIVLSSLMNDIYPEEKLLNALPRKLGHPFSGEEKRRIHAELDSHYKSEKIDEVMQEMSTAKDAQEIPEKDYEIELAIAIV